MAACKEIEIHLFAGQLPVRAVFTWLSKGIGFGFTTPFGWLVYLLWFWFYHSLVKTALKCNYRWKTKGMRINVTQNPLVTVSVLLTGPLVQIHVVHRQGRVPVSFTSISCRFRQSKYHELMLFMTPFLFDLRHTCTDRFGIAVVRPPGRGANSSQDCRPCSFCNRKQRCSTILWAIVPKIRTGGSFYLGVICFFEISK